MTKWDYINKKRSHSNLRYSHFRPISISLSNLVPISMRIPQRGGNPAFPIFMHISCRPLYIANKATMIIFVAIVASPLDLCNRILTGTADDNIKRLQREQNALARVVHWMPQIAHILPNLAIASIGAQESVTNSCYCLGRLLDSVSLSTWENRCDSGYHSGLLAFSCAAVRFGNNLPANSYLF